MGYFRTVKAIAPLVLERWWGTGCFLLVDAYGVVGFATDRWAPADWKAAMSNLPPWAYVVFVLLALVWALFVALHGIRKQRDGLLRISDYEAALDGLGELFDRGTQILNLTVSSERELGVWETVWHDWRNKVEQYLLDNQFGQRERFLFRNSVLVDPNLADGFSDRHVAWRNQLVRKLEILRDTIIRHCNQASLWRSEVE